MTFEPVRQVKGDTASGRLLMHDVLAARFILERRASRNMIRVGMRIDHMSQCELSLVQRLQVVLDVLRFAGGSVRWAAKLLSALPVGPWQL